LSLDGLHQRVECLEFSGDGQFLAASAQNQVVCVWNVSTGERIYGRRTEQLTTMLVFSQPYMGPGSRYPYYHLCTADDQNVLLHTVEFDLRTMSYALRSDDFQLPAAGLQRRYTCGSIIGDFLVAGTHAGDICVFSMTHRVFRTSVPVCNGGVVSLVPSDQGIFIGGGDGKLKTLAGADITWEVLAEATLEFSQAPISSLSLSADRVELVAGTVHGKIFRVLTSDLSSVLVEASHTGPVNDVAFPPGVSDVAATVSEQGELFVWDLSTYAHISSAVVSSAGRCVSMTGTHETLVGYEDGFVRAWCTESGQHGRLMWQIANAHRGAVTCIAQSNDVIITGGEDMVTRVWHRSTRELLTQFQKHRKAVAAVKLDEEIKHYFHTCAEDRTVCTYDLKQNKTVVVHTIQAGNMTGLSQRKDHEKEMVTCGLDGRILFWDVDYADPVGALSPSVPFHEGTSKLTCVSISPSGRFMACAGAEHLLYLFDLQSCEQMQTLEGHSKAVKSLAWSGDERQIITVSDDGCMAVWNFFNDM
jgi:WD40 repeat protein